MDDEQPARERLKQLLAGHADVAVVGEAEDGVQAAELIAERQPDVVFLDIQMPGASGIDVAASLGARRPLIVFCTAFDQYAVDAFELSATDYLLKPVNRARLAAALDRVRLATGDHAFGRTLASATRDAGLSPTRVLARRGNRYKVVPMADVVAFTFTDGVTRVVTATEHPDDAADPRGAGPAPRSVALLPGLADGASSTSTPFVKRDPSPTAPARVLLANGQTVPVTRRRWRVPGREARGAVAATIESMNRRELLALAGRLGMAAAAAPLARPLVARGAGARTAWGKDTADAALRRPPDYETPVALLDSFITPDRALLRAVPSAGAGLARAQAAGRSASRATSTRRCR